MFIVPKTVEIYVANDGKDFIDKDECLKYEESIRDMKYFMITCCPDLTEGRGYYKGYIAKCTFGDSSISLVEEHCRKEFGRNYDFVMGCVGQNAFMKRYLIREIDVKEAKKIVESNYKDTILKLVSCVTITLDDNGDVKTFKQDTII